MKKIAIVGAGVSGLTCARCLRDRYDVTVFEKEAHVGGLIRCERVEGSLFHLCGGHVFNTKNQDVLNWFWSIFDKESEFVKADRRSAVCMDDGRFIDYPIENHIYQLDESVQRGIIADLKKMIRENAREPSNFQEFLLSRFGKTLYELYFKPYNVKVWRRDLSQVPLSWLAGKLPMPTVDEVLLANINHLDEKQFVHSTFYYGRDGGSQFIADKLAAGNNVKVSSPVAEIRRTERGWEINDVSFDKVIFCGNLKHLPEMVRGFSLDGYVKDVSALESHGTTAVFCKTDPIPYSWFYQPSTKHKSHRFICTGNFSPSNNASGVMTCTVEFTDEIGRDEIMGELLKMPYHPRYLAHHYSRFTYPIQHLSTRKMVQSLREDLASAGLYLCGRFAEWEYYNMDAAMASALDLCKKL